ncbi:TIM barrel protein [Microbacterium lushaniae]|uniref:TIM barrel protein n=2 Tax=Microbacterium lushaniae TaxID=2614639 RepID=A0A5J6L6K8_9MICO|nr:TIM barrel protein [Microbacterium lushaniae]
MMSVDVGIQLYSVRNAMAVDAEGTLARLAELGFTRVEGANHEADTDPGIGFGISADRLAAVLEANGLSIVGSHINPLDVGKLGPTLDFHAGIGSPGIGCDIEFYPYGDVDHVKRRADAFNRVGELCAQRGMVFYYHNHFQEFQEFDGTPVYELILQNTDPALVKIEMDTFWVYRGGHDPLEWIDRYPDRVILTHQKDFPRGFSEPLNLFDGIVDPRENITLERFLAVKNPLSFVEIGTGILPIQDIITTLDGLPAFRCMVLEQDFSTNEDLESARISRDAFSRLHGTELEIRA